MIKKEDNEYSKFRLFIKGYNSDREHVAKEESLDLTKQQTIVIKNLSERVKR